MHLLEIGDPILTIIHADMTVRMALDGLDDGDISSAEVAGQRSLLRKANFRQAAAVILGGAMANKVDTARFDRVADITCA